ncbi:hypothetical protein [Palleronia caenipelagi]|uniref:Uncharacterized protein n=1 Tax=Palleronia caenipelagi TaxID=2489174 RepID=A0A547PKQ6_9RHOB|nr:hypothetical protein [Palleronia caenipelagi]TRD14701.1 hypothetical protein FEV53_18455 [Palleronia caenipelagi]
MKDNGATVFRVQTNTKSGRVEFERIAVAVVKTGAVKSHAEVSLTSEERSQISDWIRNEQEAKSKRLVEEMLSMARDVSLATHQLSTSDHINEDVLEATNDLLVALLDMQREVTSVMMKRRANEA